MAELQASRTLLKSGPELWAECREAGSLAKHLGEFGEIRITKLEPENAVAWEGDAVSGTVRLEAAGWGTRVTLTVHDTREPPVAESAAVVEPPAIEPPAAAVPEPEPEPHPELETEPEPEPVQAAPAPRPGMLARMLAAFRRPPAPATPEPVAVSAEPDARAAGPEPPAVEPAPRAAEPAPPALEPDLPAAEPVPPAVESAGASAERADRMLDAALDSLGRAHHRPYSRA
jgi:hypothetical protein